MAKYIYGASILGADKNPIRDIRGSMHAENRTMLFQAIAKEQQVGTTRIKLFSLLVDPQYPEPIREDLGRMLDAVLDDLGVKERHPIQCFPMGAEVVFPYNSITFCEVCKNHHELMFQLSVWESLSDTVLDVAYFESVNDLKRTCIAALKHIEDFTNTKIGDW